MASRKSFSARGKRATGTRAPANWYAQTGAEQWRERLARQHIAPDNADAQARAVFLAEKRTLRVGKLKDDLEQLRRYFRGFTAADGYDLRDIKTWHLNRVRSVERYAEYLNHLLSQPNSRIEPRTKTEMRGVRNFTGQRLRRQFAFVVHKPTDRDEVAIGPRGEVVIVRELPTGGFLQSEFYFFDTVLGYQPLTWDEVVEATEEIVEEMPEGMYFIYSELHGEIDTPHRRDILPRLMRRYEQEYSQKKFADTIRGFKRVADDITPNQEYEQLFKRRQARKETKTREWNRLRKQIHREVKRREIPIAPVRSTMPDLARLRKAAAKKLKVRKATVKKVAVKKNRKGKKKTKKTRARHK